MRELTKKQKKFIEDLINKSKNFVCERTIYKVEDIKNDDWEIIQEMNDTEVLYQNVNCYLDDLD